MPKGIYDRIQVKHRSIPGMDEVSHYWDKSESHTIELLLDDGILTFPDVCGKTKKKRSDAVLQEALAGLLNKKFSTKKRKVNISASDLVSAKSIGHIVKLIEAAKNLADDQGV